MLTCLCISFAVGCRSPKGASVKEKRSYVLQMKRETLAELYKEHPDAKARVARAPGHAVFSLVGSKILMLATGNGFGVATDAKTGRNTFMRMVEEDGGGRRRGGDRLQGLQSGLRVQRRSGVSDVHGR
jgi:hypothetical protein